MIRRLGQRSLLGFVFLVGLGLGVGYAATPTGHLVLLSGAEPQPKALTAELGAVVVWLNRTADRPLSFAFEGSPSPDPTCPSGRGFVRRSRLVYTLPALPPGGTASLCFPFPGTYTYVVHGFGQPVSGTVTVGDRR